jgi:hypothetical protein
VLDFVDENDDHSISVDEVSRAAALTGGMQPDLDLFEKVDGIDVYAPATDGVLDSFSFAMGFRAQRTCGLDDVSCLDL